MPKINEEKKIERRKRILTAAMKCFSEKGYSRTKMDDIVAESGISKGGIYLYYKSKEAVFQAIADQVLENRKSLLSSFDGSMCYSEMFKKYLITILSNYKTEDAQRRIRFSFEFWIENSDKEYLGSISKKSYLDKRFKRSFEDLNQIIKGGIKSGEFREDINSKALFFIIYAAIDGIAFYSGILERDLPKNCTRVFSDIFNNYLRKE